jgi:adenine-specific DNA glycosylase
METVASFPSVKNVLVDRAQAEDVASYWRGLGYRVTVARRTVKAARARVEVHVVVVTGEKKS